MCVIQCLPGPDAQNGWMAETFEFRDLSGSAFWSVDLRGATFRDVELAGAQISHSRVVNVDIDAVIDGLVVNGVDVTAYVNQRDRWFALRSQLFPTEADRMRAGWPMFVTAWSDAIAGASCLPDSQLHASVNGQWSFVQTLRHLVMATDKWFTAPVLGGGFHPIGLPNTGSLGFAWPGIDLTLDPTFGEAVAIWRDRALRLQDYLDQVEQFALAVQVEVLENGPTEVHDCVGVVFEEHFQHLRYALRDLDHLG